MRWLTTIMLCNLSCATAVPVPELARDQLMRRASVDAPECVQRFISGAHDHPKVRWSSCVSADRFLDVYRSTSIDVTLKFKDPLGDITRATMIEAGIPPTIAERWPSQIGGQPVYVVGASIELERLLCFADLSSVERLTVEESACVVPVTILAMSSAIRRRRTKTSHHSRQKPSHIQRCASGYQPQPRVAPDGQFAKNAGRRGCVSSLVSDAVAGNWAGLEECELIFSCRVSARLEHAGGPPS